MESDKLLAAIKNRTVTTNELKAYVSPLLSKQASKSAEKYQRFVLKAIKLIIQQLAEGGVSDGNKHFYLQLSAILVLAIGTSPIIDKAIAPLSFEKLLIHLISQANKYSDRKSVESCCALLRDRLYPLVDQVTAAELAVINNLLNCAANQLANMAKVSEQKGLINWDNGLVEIWLSSLEMLHHSQTSSEIELVKKYSYVVSCCIKKRKLEGALSVMRAVLSLKLQWKGKECIKVTAGDYVRIRVFSIQQQCNSSDNIQSFKEMICQSGINSDDLTIQFLKEELAMYNTLNDDALFPSKLCVINDLLSLLKARQSSLLHWGHTSLIKAILLYEQGDTQSALETLRGVIPVAETTTTKSSSEDRSLAFDLLGGCHLWQSLCLYRNALSGSVSDDNGVVIGLTNAVYNWDKLKSTIELQSITQDETDKSFFDFRSTCSHMLTCLSLCILHCLIPQALSSIDTLLYFCQWNKSLLNSIVQSASLLALKTRLLVNSYGEGFVGSELELNLKESLETEEDDKCLIECRLALAILYCRRGQFSLCNKLLKEVVANPLVTKNSPDGHGMASLLASVTSQYVESQSAYIPLLDHETCFNRLTTEPSPICIDCITEVPNHSDCGRGRGGLAAKSGLTELELAIDSFRLTRGISKLLATSHHHQQQQQSSDQNTSTTSLSNAMTCLPAGLFSTDTFWKNLFELFSSLLRVSRLYYARESMGEAQHYANEGLELAEIMQLKYWKVKFMLLLVEIKHSLGKTAEIDEAKKTIKDLLKPSYPGSTKNDSTDGLSAAFNRLTLQVEEEGSCPGSCRCMKCVNPVRLVLTCQYFHMLIETSDHSCDTEHLLKQVKQITNTDWIKSCSFFHPSTSPDPDESRRTATKKTTSRTRKAPKSSSSDSTSVKHTGKTTTSDSSCFNSEIIVPIVIQSNSLRVHSLLNNHKNSREAIERSQKTLDILRPIALPLLHSPKVRLRLAQLYYAIGVLKLSNADTQTLKDIYHKPCPVGTGGNQPTRVAARQDTMRTRSRRARRFPDSGDEEDEGVPSEGESSLLPPSLMGFVPDFLSCYQLLSPTTLSLRLTKQLYGTLGVCLSIWRSNTAAHLFLHSSYLSFSMEGVLWIWKKIRHYLRQKKHHHLVNLVINDIDETISSHTPKHDHTPSIHTCDDEFVANLVRSRSILKYLTQPLPKSFTDALISQMPTDWVYCSMAVVDTMPSCTENKSVVLVRVDKGHQCVIVKLPININEESASDDMLNGFSTAPSQPFGLLHSILDGSEQSVKLTEKAEWWDSRRKLDSDMKKFIELLQVDFLSVWKILLVNASIPPSLSPTIKRISSILIKCGIAATFTDVWTNVLMKGRHTIDSTANVSSILRALGCTQSSSMDEKLLYKELVKCQPCSFHSCPVILSLSHPLHQLPFESLPILRDKPMSRVPSLTFLIAHSIAQLNRPRPPINSRATYYIVNPKGDLKKTEQVFAKWFEKEEGWEGVVGTPPTTEQFVYGFEKRSVMIYCGHGKAREFLKEGHIQELDCQAIVFQMGCSSGQLQNPGGDIEPNGIVLNFLLAGCPSLVVNLWNVTDGDIDRFCTALIKNWLLGDEDKKDYCRLLKVVGEARDHCKLKYLIGASPVVYGLPILK